MQDGFGLLVGVMLAPCTCASWAVCFARSGLMHGFSRGVFAQTRHRYGSVRPALRHSLLPGIITMSACLKKHAYRNEKGAPLTASGPVLRGPQGLWNAHLWPAVKAEAEKKSWLTDNIWIYSNNNHTCFFCAACIACRLDGFVVIEKERMEKIYVTNAHKPGNADLPESSIGRRVLIIYCSPEVAWSWAV